MFEPITEQLGFLVKDLDARRASIRIIESIAIKGVVVNLHNPVENIEKTSSISCVSCFIFIATIV